MLERLATERGELVLRAAGKHFEVISNGVFLMDTRNGESERLLIRAALTACPSPSSVLIGGLGVGFSLDEALADPRVTRVVVVEIEPAIVAWHGTHLADRTGRALDNARVHVVVGDLLDHLRSTEERYDVICLDIDNGPEWTVTPANAALYTDSGTMRIRDRLADDGVLSVWSASAAPAYEAHLRDRFASVAVHQIPASRGEPDIVMVAKGPRGVRRRHGNPDSS